MASGAADLLIRILGDSRSAVDSMLGLRRDSESTMTAVRNAVRAATTQLDTDAGRVKQALTGMFDDVKADQLIAQLQAGGDAGEEAAREIMQALGNIQSEADRAAAGLSIFGDAWPDIERQANQSMDSIQQSLRDVSSRANTEAEQMAQALSGVFDDVTADRLVRELQSGGQAGEDAAREISQALAQVEDDIDRNRHGLVIFGDAWRDVEQDARRALDNIQGDLRETDNQVNSATDGLAALTDGLAALGISITGAQVAGGLDSVAASMGYLRAITGQTGEEMAELEKIAKQVFASGFGTDLRNVSEVVARVNQTLKLTGTELQNQSENVFRVSNAFEAFGADHQLVTEAARAMTAAFTIDAQQAFDVMTVGFQQGAGNAGDLLDTLIEYPANFQTIGLGAEDMLRILTLGMENGAHNTDKMADAIKEFGILVKSEGDTAQMALHELFPESEANRLIQAFGDGGEAARAAFYQVFQALSEISDPLEQYNMAVMLMGTLAEDLTQEVLIPFIASLAEQKDVQLELEGATESLNQQYTGWLATLEGVKRSLQMSIIAPMGEAIPVAAGLIDIGSQLAMVFLGLQAAGVDVGGAIGKVGLALRAAMLVVTSLASKALPALGGAFAALLSPIGLVVAAVIAVAGLAYLVMKNWEPIKTFFADLWGAVRQVFGATVEAMKAPFRSFVNFVLGGINAIIRGLNKLQVSVPKWVPGIGGNTWGVNISQIPMLAKGGDITSPGWAIVGEKGPELGYFPRGAGVRPLPTGTGTGRQTMEHTGTIRVEGVNDRGQLMGVVDIVMEQLRQEVRV